MSKRKIAFEAVVALVASASSPVRGESQAEPYRSGLPWVQFHGSDFTRPAESGIDRQLNLDTGATIQDYSRIWKGAIKWPAGGEVTFQADADDELELYINDKPVIDSGGARRSREGTCVAQTGQLVPIEVRFRQKGGTAHLRLYWSTPGKAKELVPESAFWHQKADAEQIKEMLAGRLSPRPKIDDKSSIYKPGLGPVAPATEPIPLGVGPHLFIDDHLVGSSTNVVRTVNRPERQLKEPIVHGKKGKGDNCFQPYMSVLRDPKTGRFRIWYGVHVNETRSRLGYMESDDGINWIRPHRVLDDPGPIQFGVSILDEGPEFPDAANRFKYAYWWGNGMMVAGSPDGLTWKLLSPRSVLEHNHDICNIYKDRVRNRYMGICSTYVTGPRWSGNRRVTVQSVSDDLIHWAKPWRVLTPDDTLEQGETQFYAMCGFLQRGDLLIGMVKVLHDDFAADPGGPKAGVGWTSLAWSRDGEHWVRDREVFFDRHPASGEWDHAMAWIDWQLPVGDEVYLYYGGYARGHKINRFEERQIGLVKILQDRYVARESGESAGTLRTPTVLLDGSRLTVNAKVDGEMKVRILDAAGKPLPGFDESDGDPIRGDSLRHAVQWKGDLASVRGKAVRLEFSLRNARLFGFELVR